MSFRDERESVPEIPASLAFCRVDGEARTLARLSPQILWIEGETSTFNRVTLYLYRPARAEYDRFELHDFSAEPARRSDGAALVRLCLNDSQISRAIRRALNDYARYVESWGEWGADAYGQFLTAYPLDQAENFPVSPEQQRKTWFEALCPLPEPEGELALALNCAELWQLYLSHPASKFFQLYAQARDFPASILPKIRPRRLYIGNPYCRFVFPDPHTLRSIAQKAAEEAFQITLVTAEMRCGSEGDLDSLLLFAADRGFELEVNDWGVLERASNFDPRPAITLGTQLNRRRKDPRTPWKAGFGAHASLLGENALNDELWLKYLKNLGIKRCEFERCGYYFTIPKIPASLHLPFYQTNTGLWCPLKALCERGERGAQRSCNSCPQWCSNNAILYPNHLRLIGRWNSLLALDNRPWDGEFMKRFDRWVLNF